MRSGDTIGNLTTGECLTILTGEEETGGALQLYRVQRYVGPHPAESARRQPLQRGSASV